MSDRVAVAARTLRRAPAYIHVGFKCGSNTVRRTVTEAFGADADIAAHDDLWGLTTHGFTVADVVEAAADASPRAPRLTVVSVWRPMRERWLSGVFEELPGHVEWYAEMTGRRLNASEPGDLLRLLDALAGHPRGCSVALHGADCPHRTDWRPLFDIYRRTFDARRGFTAYQAQRGLTFMVGRLDAVGPMLATLCRRGGRSLPKVARENAMRDKSPLYAQARARWQPPRGLASLLDAYDAPDRDLFEGGSTSGAAPAWRDFAFPERPTPVGVGERALPPPDGFDAAAYDGRVRRSVASGVLRWAQPTVHQLARSRPSRDALWLHNLQMGHVVEGAA